jgi:hypothetical protein
MPARRNTRARAQLADLETVCHDWVVTSSLSVVALSLGLIAYVMVLG